MADAYTKFPVSGGTGYTTLGTTTARTLFPGGGSTGLTTIAATGAGRTLFPSPASLAPPPGTPVFWFDARSVDGSLNASMTNGQQVGTWVNLGSAGTAANFVQATGGLCPIFKAVASAGKINNSPSLSFTPTQWMQTPNVASMAQPNVVCQVVKPIAGNGTVSDGNDSVNRNDTLFSTGTFQLFAGAALYNSTITATTGVYHVVRSLFNGTSSTMRINKSTSTAGTSPGAAALDGLSCGVAGDATTPLNGEIVCMLVYGAGTAPADNLLDSWFDTAFGSSWPQ